MAQQALAFERQEPLTIIAPHYAEVEKRDLLAAERLLTDINKLDQYRLTTEQRRKELTKVISLASVAPVEFQQLRRQGWMSFATLFSWFDRDFPGHYMRLIKSVSLSVVGLIAPGEAIHATLSNSGFSQVMVGPPYNEPKTIQRPAESIALTAASNGTGLFELRLDDPILLPFEGSGVQTSWDFEMPRGANHFDYETLVDVLFTIRYTALDDPDYRRKALKQLGADTQGRLPIQGMTSLSMRTSFPDTWYHLHNPIFLADPAQYGFEPGKTPLPYVAEFEVAANDFPPNEDVQRSARLTLALSQERFVKAPLEIEFQPDGKAPDGKQYAYRAQADYTWNPDNTASGPLGLASFAQRREASAPPTAAWETVATPVTNLKPFGIWRLRIRTDVASGAYPELFRGAATVNNQVKLDLSWLKDALFVVTYDATVEYRYAQ
jgi:hypothetical protein